MLNCFCEGGIGELENRKILEKSEMFNDLKFKNADGNYTFVQDDVPRYKSFLTKLFLKKRCTFYNHGPQFTWSQPN